MERRLDVFSEAWVLFRVSGDSCRLPRPVNGGQPRRADDSPSEFIGTYLILPLHYSPTSAIIPFVILVTSYSILCRVRVPEIDLGTERRLDEEERLVGDD